jgi:hypothetical protein
MATGGLTDEQKAREARIRRMASRKGFTLHRSRSNTGGLYWLSTGDGRIKATGMTLEGLEDYLIKDSSSLLVAVEGIRAVRASIMAGGMTLSECDDRDMLQGCLMHIKHPDGATATVRQCHCGALHTTLWKENEVVYTDDVHPIPRKEAGDERAGED